MSAASAELIVGKFLYIPVGAIIGVRTSGIWIVVTAMPSAATSGAKQRENASSAFLLATYAAKRGGYACPPIEVMLMMCPSWRSRMPVITAMISAIAPK